MAKAIPRSPEPTAMEIFRLAKYERDQFPLSVIRTDTHRSYPSHSHDFTELILVLTGEGIHRGPSGDYPFQAGDVFVLEPGSTHSYDAPRPFSLVNIMFDAERLRLPDHDLRLLPGYHALFHLGPWARTRGNPGSLRLNETDRQLAEELSTRLIHELKERELGYQSLAAAILTELIVFLCRRLRNTGGMGQSAAAVGKALSRMEQSFTEPLTLEDLAKEANMSVRSFQRRFKEAVGHTPFEHLLALRVGRAKALLRDPSLTMSEIAFLTGFRDSNYFARQFRSLEGVSPSASRKHALRSGE
jgi:AraC family L-rhamnose operon transcriptional activator RhaR/AraC family L-rhamnose operon regulatory protein RhaS